MTKTACYALTLKSVKRLINTLKIKEEFSMIERLELIEILQASNKKSSWDKTGISLEASRAINTLIYALDDDEAEAARNESLK
jgi:hypothetical protein